MPLPSAMSKIGLSRSLPASRQSVTDSTNKGRPLPNNLLEFVPYACEQLQASFEVKFTIAIQDKYEKAVENTKKRRKIPLTRPTSLAASRLSTTSSRELESSLEPQSCEVVLVAVLDEHERLVELVFRRCVEIPRMLFQVIGMCVPYYPSLYRITVRWGPLTAVVLYEMSKFLAFTYLTDICLDDSPIRGCNYQVLLTQTSNLHYLSLARCNLDDHDCINLTNMLAYPLPASRTLVILTLDSNRIGDSGACAFGKVLRSNRNLQHLNLAGNHITDRGAICILKSLMEFRITHDEGKGKMSRHLEYIKLRKEMFPICFKKLIEEKSQDEFRMARRRTIHRLSKKFSIASSNIDLTKRVELLITERIGPFNDPFRNEMTVMRAGQRYCTGNMALCSLNLSYNNLQYQTLVTLCDVMLYQNWYSNKEQSGLLRVVIEGNDMPMYCEELERVDDLLERAQLCKLEQVIGRRPSEKGRKARYLQ